MTDVDMKKCSTSLVIREKKTKTCHDATTHTFRTATIKKKIIPHVGKDIEQLELGHNAYGSLHFGKLFGSVS